MRMETCSLAAATDSRKSLTRKPSALADDHSFAVLTVLADGRVLITGGYNLNIQPTDKAWIYS
jgi:hypothetical protein